MILKIPLTRRAGADAIGPLLARANAPSAAVCFNDVVALGVMVGLQQRGLLARSGLCGDGGRRPPEAAVNYPALTTVATSPREVGAAAANLLLRRIAEPQGQPRSLVVLFPLGSALLREVVSLTLDVPLFHRSQRS